MSLGSASLHPRLARAVLGLLSVVLVVFPVVLDQHVDAFHTESVIGSETVAGECGLDHPPTFETAERIELPLCPGCLLQARSGGELLVAAAAPYTPASRVLPIDPHLPPLAGRVRLAPARGPPTA